MNLSCYLVEAFYTNLYWRIKIYASKISNLSSGFQFQAIKS